MFWQYASLSTSVDVIIRLCWLYSVAIECSIKGEYHVMRNCKCFTAVLLFLFWATELSTALTQVHKVWLLLGSVLWRLPARLQTFALILTASLPTLNQSASHSSAISNRVWEDNLYLTRVVLEVSSSPGEISILPNHHPHPGELKLQVIFEKCNVLAHQRNCLSAHLIKL